jgi:hypothetical protein
VAHFTRFTATVTVPSPFLDRSRGGVVGDGKLHHRRLCTTPSGSTPPGTVVTEMNFSHSNSKG